MKNYETILASKDAEIAELKRQLREYKKMARNFWEQANIDKMTACYNRNFYENDFKKRLSLGQFPVAIFMIDCNGLKSVNDNYGHEVGDEYIITSANVLRKSLPDNSIIIRLGGDEFVAAIPNCDEKKAIELMFSIAENASKTRISNGIEISMSVGHACMQNAYISSTELLKAADEEMYANKTAYHAKIRKLAI